MKQRYPDEPAHYKLLADLIASLILAFFHVIRLVLQTAFKIVMVLIRVLA